MVLVASQTLGYWPGISDPFSLAKYAMLCACLPLLWSGVRRTCLDLPVALYAAAIAATSLMGSDPKMSVLGQYGAYYDGLLPTLAVIGAFYCGTAGERSKIERWLVTATAMSAVIGLVQWASPAAVSAIGLTYPLQEGRIYSTIGGAAYLSGAYGLAASLALRQRRWICAAVTILCLLLCGGRTGYLVLAVAAAVFSLLRLPGRAGLAVALALFCWLVAGIMAVGTIRQNSAASDRGRYHMLRVAAKAFLDKPLLGHGPDTFHLLMQKYRDKQIDDDLGMAWSNGYSHNFLGDWLATTGLLGTAAAVFLAASLVLAVRKDADLLALLAGLAAFGAVQCVPLHVRAVVAYLAGSVVPGRERLGPAWNAAGGAVALFLALQTTAMLAGSRLMVLASRHKNDNLARSAVALCPNAYR